jgi:predicted PurR-regulated permease PerM
MEATGPSPERVDPAAGGPAAEPAPATPTDHAYPRPPILTARALVLLIPGTILAALLVIAAPALWIFMVGALYMVAVYPAVQALAHRGLNRGVAILVIYAASLILIVLFLTLVLGVLVQQVIAFVAALPDLLHQVVTAFHDVLQAVGVSLGPDVQQSLQAFLLKVVDAVEAIVTGLAGGVIATGFTIIGSLAAFLIVPFWAFYVMNSWPRLSGALDRHVPPEWLPDVRVAMDIMGTSFALWLQAQLKASVIAGIFAFIEFQILGILVDPIFRDFALLLATISFVFEFIPNIGPTIAFIPQLMVGLLAGPIGVIAVIIGFAVAQQLENAVIIPRIQGKANELHPAVILFVLVLGGAIFGILGIILSVPVTATVVRLTSYFFGRASGKPAGPLEAASEAAGVVGPSTTVPADTAAAEPIGLDEPAAS